jgi:serine/threonine protein phosphatase PrpC
MTANGQLALSAAFASRRGRREDNQDYAGIAQVSPQDLVCRGFAVAVADGMGGAKGGRVAAELCMHSFMEAYYSLAETLTIEQSLHRSLESANRWIHAMGKRDPNLAHMATTFSALILRGRRAHLVHVGDSRIYRLRGERLERLTTDHSLNGPELSHILYRAVGLESSLRTDYAVHTLEIHDRFLLCSDGLHGALKHAEIARILLARATPQSSADALVDAALERDGSDNITALVVDIIALPRADRQSLREIIESLPILELPSAGDTVDDFHLEELLSSGRYSALFRAVDRRNGNPVAIKFPHPRVASERQYHDAFVREAWIGGRVKSPWVAEILEQTRERQTRLYSVMPYYHGVTLETRLKRNPRIGLEPGIDIALKLCKAVHALHRQQIVHRDIKPDNILLLGDGGLKLLDLGIARLPAWDEDQADPMPGTPSYMAPELFHGERGSVASDIFALGVTLYRLFSGGAYPYGEIEPFTTPRFGKPRPLTGRRPDLPVWLDAALARAIAVDPAERYADAIELAFELESGLCKGGGKRLSARSLPLYQRNPVLFWQLLALLLFGLLMVCLFQAYGRV